MNAPEELINSVLGTAAKEAKDATLLDLSAGAGHAFLLIASTAKFELSITLMRGANIPCVLCAFVAYRAGDRYQSDTALTQERFDEWTKTLKRAALQMGAKGRR